MIKKDRLDFVVIGAQKCATTWLYDCLKDHPQLSLRDSKNEDEYYGGKLYLENGGDEWYFKKFNSEANGKLKGCVSVEYLQDFRIPENLLHHNEKIKLIASLRNPTNRALSAYQWYVRKAYIPDLPLEAGLTELLRHYKGKVHNDYTKIYNDIIERGYYAERLQPFTAEFDKSQLHLTIFEDLNRNPLKTIQDVASFLSIDAGFVPPKLDTVPKKNTGVTSLIKIQRLFPNSKIAGKFVDLTNQLLPKKIVGVPPATTVSQEIIHELNELYQVPNEQLSQLLAQIDPVLSESVQALWSNKTKELT